MIPFVQDADFTLYQGDVLDVLRELPDESVHCCVTSPPYWGLRDYGTGSWEGGDADCEHSVGGQVNQTKDRGTLRENAIAAGQRPGVDASACRKCGALRVDQQLGLEPTPEAYVARMVAVFTEVRRVLRADGTLWLNIGDSYASSPPGNKGTPDEMFASSGLAGAKAGSRYMETLAASVNTKRSTLAPGLKPKDLVGIPWRLAFALQADGWYLRSDIIWSKPNPMPESVTDRPTKAHEYVFLLTRSARYFFNADAVREGYKYDGRKVLDREAGPGSHENHRTNGGKRNCWPGIGKASHEARGSLIGHGHDESEPMEINHVGRNVRSVWEIATQPYPEAHFATFPEALVERCVKAGCPQDGTVLDPFLGSGTTAYVARKLGRRSIGIELNADYCALAARRMQQQSLLTEIA